MSKGASFNVLFIGYMAQIQKEPQVVHASLDFVSGYVTLQADGGVVYVPRIRDLRPFVSSLRQDIDELRKRSGEECCEIKVSHGNNTLCFQRGGDVSQLLISSRNAVQKLGRY